MANKRTAETSTATHRDGLQEARSKNINITVHSLLEPS